MFSSSPSPSKKEPIAATHPLILETIRKTMTPTPPEYREYFAGVGKESHIAYRCNGGERMIFDRSVFTALRNAVDAYERSVDNLVYMKKVGPVYMGMKKEEYPGRYLTIATDYDYTPESVTEHIPPLEYTDEDNTGSEEEVKKKKKMREKQHDDLINKALYDFAIPCEEMLIQDIANYIPTLVAKVNSVMISKPKIASILEDVADVEDVIAQEKRARGRA